VWDFARSGANVFRAHIDGRWRDVVGIGEKSGVYWTFDARSGRLLWATLVEHGDDPGGIQWGTAVDGERIYAAIGHTRGATPYVLPSGETITGGSWAALDPSNGKILWQTPDCLLTRLTGAPPAFDEANHAAWNQEQGLSRDAGGTRGGLLRPAPLAG
jgi:polyvinyl alcohol dehydrogenase (cytochrome)